MQDILLKPKEAWPRIAQEETDMAAIHRPIWYISRPFPPWRVLWGCFYLLLALAALGLLASLYSVYLVYTGLPVLMK